MSNTMKVLFFGSYWRCGQCNSPLISELQYPEDYHPLLGPREWIHCSYRECENFNKKFRYPAMELVELVDGG